MGNRLTEPGSGIFGCITYVFVLPGQSLYAFFHYRTTDAQEHAQYLKGTVTLGWVKSSESQSWPRCQRVSSLAIMALLSSEEKHLAHQVIKDSLV